MDQALKQRLIGASILIALAIIFVPMLLDEPVMEDGPTSLDIPPRPEAPVHTRRIAAQPDEGGEAVAGSRLSPMDEITAMASRRQRPLEDRDLDSLGSEQSTADRLAPIDNTEADAASDPVDNNSTGIALRQSEDNISSPPASEVAASAAATNPGSSSSAVDSSPASTDLAANDADQEADSTDGEKSRILDNSPPVAANAASSLITPSDEEADGMATGSGVNASSGLIPDDQWALQVASFGATENASRLARRLREMGYNPNMDTVYRGGAALHRVRVGPFSNRQAAVAAGERITANISDLRPRPVAPKSGDIPVTTRSSVANTSTKSNSSTSSPAPSTSQTTPATASTKSPEEGLHRFAVQLGSFAGADNADRLQTRVREAGYAAFVERVDRQQGIRYLVKVGPLLSRNDANSTRDRIERELGVKGILVDYL